jgi:S-adenosylmethionine:tRNA ribosyltransferase-isomerase
MASPDLESLLGRYNYNFPSSLIAKQPAHPRDSARLLVLERQGGRVTFDRFKNLGKYLPKNAVLVMNQTRVIPARLGLVKATGGKLEALFLNTDGKNLKILSGKKLTVGSQLKVVHATQYSFTVLGKEASIYRLKTNFPPAKFFGVLTRYGQTPLPPYIKHSNLSEKQRRLEYQSVFAKAGESVAAPTASLHFTKRLLGSLKKQGIDLKFVRLDVGLGTFAPLTENNIAKKRLHSENYFIDPQTARFLNQAKKQGRPIIAVGTTVVRTLESACRGGILRKLSGETQLFISESDKIKFVNGLVTNFHVPKSSLMMLVSAFTGREKLLDIYQQAIKRKFRLFSFGDGMLVI